MGVQLKIQCRARQMLCGGHDLTGQAEQSWAGMQGSSSTSCTRETVLARARLRGCAAQAGMQVTTLRCLSQAVLGGETPHHP